ncbi:MAG TPA: TIGR00730 family Rossman fold protein [Mycobacteriales bacterium]|nr:TIGR00730 family Rossman fold protein [Mycobacteriales bacterium]
MRICVFCGSSPGRGTTYLQAATELGTLLARRGIGVVYGGGNIGLMGAVADAAMAAGGEVDGVIPQHLVDREVAHREVTELHIVADMHERKALMARLSDAFITLPGAAGTMEELFEIWTWAQLGLHEKPVGLLDVAGYYEPLRTFIDRTVTEGFLTPHHRNMLIVESDAAVLLKRFADYQAPAAKFSAGVASDLLDVDSAPPIDALGWICVRDGKALMVRSRDNELLYLPGGKRESGESDVAALSREVREEVGVHLRPESFTFFELVREPADGFADGRQVHMRCYEADFDGELTPSGEITELAWIGRDDVDRVPPAGRRVLSRLAEEKRI